MKSKIEQGDFIVRDIDNNLGEITLTMRLDDAQDKFGIHLKGGWYPNPKKGNNYFFISDTGRVEREIDQGIVLIDGGRFTRGNYFCDIDVAIKIAREEALRRVLYRDAETANRDMNLEDFSKFYYITYIKENKVFEVKECANYLYDDPCYCKLEDARKALSAYRAFFEELEEIYEKMI